MKLVLLMTLGALARGRKIQVEETDILVLGGGLAGISAGRELIDRGYDNFLVLEGRDRIGGRVRNFDEKLGNYTLEEGASWCQGTSGSGQNPNNPIYDLIHEASVIGSVTNWDSVISYDELHGTTPVPDNQIRWMDFENAYLCVEDMAQEMFGDSVLENAQENDFDLSIALKRCGFVASSPMDFVVQWFDLDYEFAVSPEETSTRTSFLSNYAIWKDEDFFVHDQEGFVKVVHKLAETFIESRARLNSRVLKITQTFPGVEVLVEDTVTGVKKLYRAKQAIVTFSNGVLQRSIGRYNGQADVVEFKPELPEWKKDAIDKVRMADYTKFYLQFDQHFWDNSYEFIMYGSWERSEMPLWQNLNVLPGFEDSNILMVTLTGSDSWMGAVRGKEEMVQLAMTSLRKIYPDAPDPIDSRITAWAEDEWTFGSYATLPVNTHRFHPYLIGYPTGDLYFAGEATEPEDYGFTHGAVISGRRVAKRLIGCLENTSDCPTETEREGIIEEYMASARAELQSRRRRLGGNGKSKHRYHSKHFQSMFNGNKKK